MVTRLVLASCLVGLAAAAHPIAGDGRPQADDRSLGQTPPGLTPKVFAPGIVSREGAQSKLLAAHDGGQILFSERDPATGRFRIVSLTRIDGTWSAPTPLPFSQEYVTNEPALSADGRRLFFVSDRPASGGGPPAKTPDIWVVEKRPGGWSEPRNLGSPVNTAEIEVQPYYGSNDELYFCRQAGGVRSLLVSRFAGGRFSDPVEVDLHLGGRRVSGPAASPDKRTLLVHSNMEGGQGGWDLYASFRDAAGRWGDLVNLGPAVNTAGAETDATFSPDGQYLFFSRDGDIYWVSTSVLNQVRTGAEAAAAGPGAAALGQIDAWLQQETAAGRFSGAVLVAYRGRAVYERGFGFSDREAKVPNTAATPFNICSMGKMFTAATALLLADEGLVDLRAPISRYLPDFPKPAADRITLHHLLSHTSGLGNHMARAGFDRESRRLTTIDSLYRRVREETPQFEPGARFSYSNSGFIVAGRIIERVTGRPYAEVVTRRLLDPLGMTHTRFHLVDERPADAARGYVLDGRTGARREPTVVPQPASDGGVHSTLADLLLFDRALHGPGVLSEKARRLMQTPNLNGYGYGLSIKPPEEHVSGHTSVGHTGGLPDRSTVLRRFVDDEVTLIVLSNYSQAAITAVKEIERICFGVRAPR